MCVAVRRAGGVLHCYEKKTNHEASAAHVNDEAKMRPEGGRCSTTYAPAEAGS